MSLGTQDLRKRVRLGTREAFKHHRLLQRILPDIDRLLQVENLPDDGTNPDVDPAEPAPWWEPTLDIGRQ